MDKYLVHYLLESKEDGFKHKHRALEIDAEAPNLGVFHMTILKMNPALLDEYHVTIVGWNKI